MASAPDLPVSEAEAANLFAPLRDRAGIALAVSGGADSSALLFLWARARAVDPTLPPAVVLTVDHRLRPEAAAEADRVAARAAEFGFPHHTLVWTESRPGGNLQARAALARRRLLLDRAADLGCDTLVLAHHADDQAETFLTRLARGSGVVGLAGMAPRRMQDGLLVARPFLALPKARLVATLVAAGLDWCEDPSNADPHYARARLRAARPVLDGLGLTRERLVATARAMARAAAALELQRATLDREAVVRHPAGWTTIVATSLLAAPEEIRLRLLSRLIGDTTGTPYGPRLDALETLDSEIIEAARDGRRLVRTLGGARIEVRRGLVWLAPEIGRTPARLRLAPGEAGLWRAERVRLSVAARGPVIVAPLGAEGRRLVTNRRCIAADCLGRPAPSAVILESVTAIFVEDRLVACPALGIDDLDPAFEAENLPVFGPVPRVEATSAPRNRQSR